MKVIFNDGDARNRPRGLLCRLPLIPGMYVAFEDDLGVGYANSYPIRLDLGIPLKSSLYPILDVGRAHKLPDG
jgi:hypothetical protein